MILEVQKKQATPEIVVLELRGRLLMGNDSRQVEWSIAEVMKEGAKKVVMDLRELDAIDSTGVGILVMCNAKLQKAGGVMRIVSSDGIVESTLQMTHVDRIVKFFDTVEAASEKFVRRIGFRVRFIWRCMHKLRSFEHPHRMPSGWQGYLADEKWRGVRTEVNFG